MDHARRRRGARRQLARARREPAELSSLLVRDGRFATHIEHEDRENASGPLAAGVYRLRTRSRHWYAPEREVEVVAGETTDFELVLLPATTRLLVLALPADDRAASVHVRRRGLAVLDLEPTEEPVDLALR